MIAVSVAVEGLTELLTELRQKREDYRHVLAHEWAKAGTLVAGVMRDRWLSGRFEGDLGLNIVTGNLHDSVKGLPVVMSQREVSGGVGNRGAEYWQYHPVRFPAFEVFKDAGERYYTTAMEEALGVLS